MKSSLFSCNRYVAAVTFLLLGLCILILWLGMTVASFESVLFPKYDSGVIWTPHTTADADVGGQSSALASREDDFLDFDITLNSSFSHPFAIWSMIFTYQLNKTGDKIYYADFSRFSAIQFYVQCNQENTYNFMLKTYDSAVTKVDDANSYRTYESYFSCGKEWQLVQLKLEDLQTPRWWLKKYGAQPIVSSRNYSEVYKIAFGNTEMHPLGISSNIKVKSMNFTGWSTAAFSPFVVLVVVILALWFYWGMKVYTDYVVSREKDKFKQEAPTLLYQPIDELGRQDKEQHAVLQYLATEYMNPDLSANVAITELGLNRNKVNEILKAEVGMTFSAYLNKLRLTESARLLRQQGMSVSEVAYAVGYNNPSYFNTLFKKEYGCTPKVFKSHAAASPVENSGA